MYGVRNETMDHKDLRLWLMLTQTTCLAAFCLYCMCIGEDLLFMKVGSGSWQFTSNQDEGTHLKTHLAQLNLPSGHHTAKTQLQHAAPAGV